MGTDAEQLAVSVSCGSRREWIDAMQSLAERVFDLAGIDAEVSYRPVLAVREAVMNAVLHGNQEREGTTLLVECNIDAQARSVRAGRGRGVQPRPTGRPAV